MIRSPMGACRDSRRYVRRAWGGIRPGIENSRRRWGSHRLASCPVKASVRIQAVSVVTGTFLLLDVGKVSFATHLERGDVAFGVRLLPQERDVGEETTTGKLRADTLGEPVRLLQVRVPGQDELVNPVRVVLLDEIGDLGVAADERGPRAAAD